MEILKTIFCMTMLALSYLCLLILCVGFISGIFMIIKAYKETARRKEEDQEPLSQTYENQMMIIVIVEIIGLAGFLIFLFLFLLLEWTL